MYSWRDQTGKLHIVDDLNKVPVEYREDVKTYRVFPGRERKGPRPRIPPRPITTVREAEEETEETSREERSGEGGAIWRGDRGGQDFDNSTGG
jgi:hypothetical protein